MTIRERGFTTEAQRRGEDWPGENETQKRKGARAPGKTLFSNFVSLRLCVFALNSEFQMPIQDSFSAPASVCRMKYNARRRFACVHKSGVMSLGTHFPASQ